MFSTKLTVFAAAAALAVASVSISAVDSSPVHLKVTLHHAKHADTNEPPKKDACVAGWTYVSVEGTGDWFCAKDSVCVAQNSAGHCPEAQCGLAYGSYCDRIHTGVFGCMPHTKESAEKAHVPFCKGEGETPMSVEGVEGVFCVTGPACVGEMQGACPLKGQNGLAADAKCARVKTGVLGCVPGAAPSLRFH